MGPGNLLVIRSWPLALRDRPKRLTHIPAAGELHLHRMHAVSRPPVVPSRITAAEAAIGHAGEACSVARSFDRARQSGRAGRAIVCTDIEVGQRALEQARNRSSGWNGSHTARRCCVCARSRLIAVGNSRMIRVEESCCGAAQSRAACGSKPGSIEGLAVKGRRRAQLSGCLPGIQGHAGRISIAVDDGTRDASANDRCAH